MGQICSKIAFSSRNLTKTFIFIYHMCHVTTYWNRGVVGTYFDPHIYFLPLTRQSIPNSFLLIMRHGNTIVIREKQMIMSLNLVSEEASTFASQPCHCHRQSYRRSEGWTMLIIVSSSPCPVFPVFESMKWNDGGHYCAINRSFLPPNKISLPDVTSSCFLVANLMIILW